MDTEIHQTNHKIAQVRLKQRYVCLSARKYRQKTPRKKKKKK